METALGRYDGALGHLREMSQLAKRFDIARLIAAARVQPGTLAVMQGRLDEASALLEEDLRLRLKMRSSTRNVSLILAAFAQLAVAEGDLEQSALLASAAEGVCQKAGLRAWPATPRREGDRATQIPQALGASRFDKLFAAGARLSQRETVAAARTRRGAG